MEVKPWTSHLRQTNAWLAGKFQAWMMTRWWFQTFFIFTPIWGRFPFWLIIIQMGWNHQLVMYTPVLKDGDFPAISSCKHCVLFPLLKNLWFFCFLRFLSAKNGSTFHGCLKLSRNLVVESCGRWWSSDSHKLRSGSRKGTDLVGGFIFLIFTSMCGGNHLQLDGSHIFQMGWGTNQQLVIPTINQKEDGWSMADAIGVPFMLEYLFLASRMHKSLAGQEDSLEGEHWKVWWSFSIPLHDNIKMLVSRLGFFRRSTTGGIKLAILEGSNNVKVW